MPNLEIKLLGELHVLYDGSAITTRIPSKSQALLAYLAATRESHSRHVLAGLFWGDRTEDKAKNSLRVAINGLRKQIPEHLEITRQSLGLKFDQAVDVDLHQLEFAIKPTTQNELPLLNAVPQIYRGEFLSGLTLDETPEFDEWLESQRASCRQIALRGLSKLTEQHLAEQAYDEALKILTRHLEIDPCAEEAHRQAMVAFSRKGDFDAALEQYARCQQALKEILNVDPAPETIDLLRSLDSAQAGAGSATAGGIKTSSQNTSATQLPSTQPSSTQPPTSSKNLLIGREEELVRLRTMLRDPFCRLITVAGLGGIGKTQLVLALLEEIIQQETVLFLHGVSFISLVGIESASLMPMTIADALDSPLSGKRDPLDDLVEMLRGKEMLIILDNFEHLIDDGVDVVSRILNDCPQIKLLVTCREWLNIASEWRLGLEGLSYPPVNYRANWHPANRSSEPSDALEGLLDYPAIQFFLIEAKRTKTEFDLAPEDVEPLIRLCHLVGGIPLALMLAATLIRNLPVEAIAAAVERDLAMLSSDVQNMPSRQRSMKVVFDSSWNQLLGYEQELFQALSVFRGGFTVDAASSLVNENEEEATIQWPSENAHDGFHVGWSLTLEILDTLASRGLVQYDEAADRYHLHELLRQLAGEKLQSDEVLSQSVQQRHSTYFCRQLGQLEIQRKGPEQVKAFASCSVEQENILAAWQTALHNQHLDVVAASVDSLGAFFEWRSGFRDAVSLFEATAEMLKTARNAEPSPTGLVASIRVSSWLANFYRLTGKIEQAVGALAQAEELLEHELLQLEAEANSGELHLALRSARAFWALQSGHLDIDVNNSRAQERYLTSVEHYRELGLEWELALALEALSMVSQSMGDLATASRIIQQSLAIRRQLGDLRGTAAAVSTLSTVVRFQGNVGRAIQLARESNELYQSIGDRSSVAEGLQNLGMTLNYVGEFSEALKLLEESIVIYRDLNNSIGLAKAHANASHVSGCLGQFDRADYHAEETITIGNTLNELRWVANGYTLKGWHAIVSGEFSEALSYAEKSLSLASNAGGHAEEDIARSVMAYAFNGLGRRDEAEQLFLTLLKIALSEEDFLPLVTAVPKIALMILEQMSQPDHGYQEDVVRLWQRRGAMAYLIMRRWPVVASSKLLEAPITIPLEKLLDELPASIMAEVEESAVTMDIWEILAELLENLPSIWSNPS